MNQNFREDTICAVATPPGVGGIAVVRVSGPGALEIAGSVWKGKPLEEAASHTAHLGVVRDPADGTEIDQAVATVFRSPRSFTGDDVVEFSVHGSRFVQRETVNLLIRQGCRLAGPGEFTRRAFAAGKIDLAEAEAVADLIAATSRASHRVALSQMRGDLSKELDRLRADLLDLASLLELELDFSEEDVEFASRQRLLEIACKAEGLTRRLTDSFATGQALREGVPVVILGKTNAGKSTLLNRLTGHDRAIVSDIHGTTRDTIDDTIEISGIPFRIIDTAGLRKTDDPVEALGIERTLRAASSASIILHLLDATEGSLEQGNTEAPGGFSNQESASVEGVSSIKEELSVKEGFAADRNRGDFQSFTPAPDATVITVINKTDLLPMAAAGSRDTFRTVLTEVDDSAGTCPHGTTPCGADDSNIGSVVETARKPVERIAISALTGEGIDRLRHALVVHSGLADTLNSDQTLLTNHRHYEALLQAGEALHAVTEALTTDLPGDLIAQDLRQALYHISAVTGAITTPEILSTIFSRFCIGK